GDYEGPDHNTNSHIADSIHYVFTDIEQDFNKETGEFLYSPANQQQTYSSDLVQTPGQYRGY
ncbi:hypothetical protein Q2441_26335, partial [Escherichia coli]|nr:hypothetical protein [Escherichia coli]